MKRVMLSVILFVVIAFSAMASISITWNAPPDSYQIGNLILEPTIFAYDFVVGQSDLLVTALGIRDYQLDGLAHSHDVAIWNADGTDAANVTIPSGTTATLLGDFRYADLFQPIRLDSGARYIIGTWYPDAQDPPYSFTSWDPTVNPFFESLGANSTTISSSELVFPGDNLDQTGPYLGPTFQFSVVPEPGTLALFLIGGTVSALLKMRRGSNKAVLPIAASAAQADR